jgi:hypothetical protein
MRKLSLLAALLSVLVVLLIHQLFWPSHSKDAPAIRTYRAPFSEESRTPDLTAELPSELAPLALGAKSPPTTLNLGERGDLFAYWAEKPPPTSIAPERVPPITIFSPSPAIVVAGTPHQLTLTIRGSNFPDDAEVYYDSNPKPTRRVAENQLAIAIQPAEYASPRTVNIEVKSAADPTNLYSNRVVFEVQALPEPDLRYIGKLGNQAVFELTASHEIKRASQGDVISRVWRIESILERSVNIVHTGYDIERSLLMQEKTR